MSSMLSAAMAMPATSHGTFRDAFTHPGTGRRPDMPHHQLTQAQSLRQGHYRDQARPRHEVRVIEECACSRQGMQQSHSQGLLSNRVLEALDTPIVPVQIRQL
jgi:hypothetical protein